MPGTSEKARRQDEEERKEFECGGKHTKKKGDGSEYKSYLTVKRHLVENVERIIYLVNKNSLRKR